MPSLPSVNLNFYTQNVTGAVHALINLSKFADGPLRLQESVENGVTIRAIGVRSWPTFFFETFIAWPCEINKAELDARKAIDQYVRPFLNNSGLAYGHMPESITDALQARVVGTSIAPDRFKKVENKGNAKSGTRAASEELKMVETKGKTFNGTGTVPTGLSFAVVMPLQMIADVRLVTEKTHYKHLNSDATRGLTCALSSRPERTAKGNTDAYEKYYFDNLMKCAGFIETSVVIELHPRDDGKCWLQQQNGAVNAAVEFAALQKEQHGKQISIMLTVPTNLPSLDEN